MADNATTGKPIVWLTYPFHHVTEHLSKDDPRRSGTIAITPAIIKTLNTPIELPSVRPGKHELDILKRRYQKADPRRPPWKDIQADLIVAGIPRAEVRQMTSVELVWVLDKCITGTTTTVENNDPGVDAKTKDESPSCYVTLLQMGSIVSRSKPTMRRLFDHGTLPPPDVTGGDGKPHEWKWSKVRPVLEKSYNKDLPDKFPADKFVRSRV